MDARTYLEAVTAAQALMSTSTPLGVDGKWGSYTQKVYEQIPAALKVRVDALIQAVAPGQSAKSLAAYRQYEKATGLAPAASRSVDASEWPIVKAALLKTAAERGYAAPQLLVAQAAHESNYGRSLLAAKYHNYGGLKAGVAAKRAIGVVNMATEEGFGATRVKTKAGFLAFRSGQDWVLDQLDYLERKTAGAIKSVKTAGEFTDMIRKFGYYTDSKSAYLAGMTSALQRA